MNPRLLELREQRGMLRARAAAQRETLAAQGRTLAQVCAVVDQVQAGTTWVKRHPALVGVALAILVAAKPARLWRWTRRAALLWQGWQALRQRLPI
ncbi:MAG: YqjK-like family protein [Zoogloeaceae bacterium]|jgi:hypothetical protein|nr:YqjK-like family protein [Zoogloeaceae bacterium]